MGDISGPLRWVREVDKRIEELERQSQESSVREDNRVLEYRRKINGLGGRLEKLEKLHYKDQPYPKDHNYPEPTHSEPKPHICGECEHTWEYTGCSPEAVSIVACRKNPKFDWKFHAVKKSQEACNEFRPRGES